MQARAGLLLLGDPLRHLLVGKHVGVAAAVAIVEGEGVTGEETFEPRVALDLLRRQGLASPVATVFSVGGFLGAQVAVANTSMIGCTL